MPGSHHPITSHYFTGGGITTHDGAMRSLAEVLEGWQPPSVEMTRRVDAWFAGAFADLLDVLLADPSGHPLPLDVR